MEREGNSQTCITKLKTYSVFAQQDPQTVESYTLVSVGEDLVVLREVISI